MEFLRDTVGDLLRTVDQVLSELPRPRAEALRKQSDLDYLTDELSPAIEQTASGLETMAELVRTLSRFGRDSGEAPARADLDEAFDATIAVARRVFSDRAELESALQALGEATCRIGDLDQALFELVRAAMGFNELAGIEHGTVRVRGWSDEGHIHVEVFDEGNPMTPEQVRQAFDPFQVGDGGRVTRVTGLALAHRVLVEEHGGQLDVDRGGARFSATIPRYAT